MQPDILKGLQQPGLRIRGGAEIDRVGPAGHGHGQQPAERESRSITGRITASTCVAYARAE